MLKYECSCYEVCGSITKSNLEKLEAEVKSFGYYFGRVQVAKLMCLISSLVTALFLYRMQIMNYFRKIRQMMNLSWISHQAKI